MPSIETVKKDYYYLKSRILKKSYKNIDDLLTDIELLSKIAYKFNFIYCDNEIEDILERISQKLLLSDPSEAYKQKVGAEEKFIFYDTFAIDNRGLTQQYLRAFKAWNVKILFILENDANLAVSNKILSELSQNPKAEIFISSSKISRVERVKAILKVVNAFQPTKIFLHMSPWDTVGNLVWNFYSNVSRYKVNLTDHAFWLGKRISDFIIDFRSYGANINIQYRGISKEKILIQPYYPIRSDEKFQGFPIELAKDNIILFAGAELYKMYGEGKLFFKIIKKILEDNPTAIFFIAGHGVNKPFLNFIREHSLSNRLILLGNRKDINEIIQRIDIYITTYPINGGLMTQFAALNLKNIVGYNHPDLKVNLFEELINTKNEILFTELDDLYREVNLLVSNRDYREKQAINLRNSILSQDEFNIELKNLLASDTSVYEIKEYAISNEKFCTIYVEAENNYLKQYNSLFFHAYKQKIFLAPIPFYKYIFSFLYNKRILKKILSRVKLMFE